MRLNPRNDLMFALVLVLPLALSGGVGAAEPLAQEARAPLPFDPLSPEEQELAVATAAGDEAVAALLSDRYEVVGAALYNHKSFLDLDAWPRMAEVWFYDPGVGRTVRSLVDLGLEQVVLVEAPEFEAPLTAREVERAGRLALADEWVGSSLADAGVDTEQAEWTGRLWADDAACPEHRCVLVGFTQGSTFFLEHTVVVDLTDQQVLGILERGRTVTHGGSAQDPGVLP